MVNRSPLTSSLANALCQVIDWTTVPGGHPASCPSSPAVCCPGRLAHHDVVLSNDGGDLVHEVGVVAKNAS